MARSPDPAGVKWLRGELPRLVEQGVIAGDVAEALDRHYPTQANAEPSRIGFVISAILGSALLGAGVILLVAHNWDDLSRPLRSVISFVPLIATQAMAFFVLSRRTESRAWNESVAIFNIAAIGTAISLISQTYQITGDFARFILVWMLLALPVVYLFQSTSGLCAYLIGAAEWVISKSSYRTPLPSLWVWLLLALAVPMLALLIRRNRNGFEALAGMLLFGMASAIALSFTRDLGIHLFGSCTFVGFLVVIYLVGGDWFFEWRGNRAHPFVPIAWVALISFVIAMSFKSCWDWKYLDWAKRLTMTIPGALIQIAWLVAGCLLGALAYRRRDQTGINLWPVFLIPVVVIAWWLRESGTIVFRGTESSLVPALLINASGLALGVLTLLRGIRSGRVFEANFGMLIVAALAVARFFDSEFEFVARGIAFIVIGAGFIITNLVIFKRKAHA